jgi:hypothetical protein
LRQNVCLTAAVSRARSPCAGARVGSVASVLATGRACADARERGKGLSDGPPEAVLQPGSGRGTVLDAALPHPARRAQNAAAHDHGPAGEAAAAHARKTSRISGKRLLVFRIANSLTYGANEPEISSAASAQVNGPALVSAPVMVVVLAVGACDVVTGLALRPVPSGLRPAVSAVAAGALLGLLVWFRRGADDAGGTGRPGR